MVVCGSESLFSLLKRIKTESENTVCIDFATDMDTGIGYDSRLMTTLGSILAPKHIPLIGTTVAHNVVSCNDVIYEEACAYAFIKNNGKIISYKKTICLVDSLFFLILQNL